MADPTVQGGGFGPAEAKQGFRQLFVDRRIIRSEAQEPFSGSGYFRVLSARRGQDQPRFGNFLVVGRLASGLLD